MKTVVITGVSKGLGRAMALRFAKEDWRVCGCGRDQAALAELQDTLGDDHLLQACDVTEETQVAKFERAVVEKAGTAPDLLLNNAGVINRNAPLWEITGDEFRKVMEINLTGVHLVLRTFLPAMMERGSGVIANFSSGWGRSTSPEVAPYCASKWGIEGLTAALAQELPNGLAAVAVNPGIIDTDMLQSCFGGEASMYPNPTDWAEATVPWLASLTTKDNGRALTAPGG